MKKTKFLLVIILLLTLSATFPGSGIAMSGKGSVWSADERVPGYLDDTFTPFLVSDQNRTVHAFASQSSKTGEHSKVIVYRQWTLAGGWTRPVDIILSPKGGDAEFMWAHLDTSGTLHVIFLVTEAMTRESSIYYSYAPAANANWAPAWSMPTTIGWKASLNSGAIIGDDSGNLVVIYSGNRDGNGVYSVSSKDSGKSWSESTPVFLTYDTKLSPFSLRLAIGPEQDISAAWNVVTELGVDEALYFANFDAESSKWDFPTELDRKIGGPDYFGPSFPAIVNNGQELVIVYNAGNPFAGRPVDTGRPIQRVLVSMNGGQVWEEPLNPFPYHVGRSGEHTLVLDGNGTPHTLFVQRIETVSEEGDYSIIGGIWHSSFQNNVWNNPDRFVTSVPPHDVRAVVVQGNVLLVVWREDPGTGQSGVWYSYGILDVPELSLVPLPTAAVDYSLLRPTQTLPIAENTLQPTTIPELLDDLPPSNLGSNPALPIIAGIIPVIMILIIVIFGYRFLTSRRE